ncbi:MAG: CBS domain-containing protein [Thermoanaerobaculia bacterium]
MRPITAADLMTPDVLTVPEEMTVRELSTFLMDNEITGAPVVDAEGRLVGVVSAVDIADMAAGEEAGDEGGDGPGRGFYDRAFEDTLSRDIREELGPVEGDEGEVRVGEIMNPEVYSVPEDAAVAQVAMTMLSHHIHRLLVIEESRVVGIITTSDLLGLLVDEA